MLAYAILHDKLWKLVLRSQDNSERMSVIMKLHGELHVVSVSVLSCRLRILKTTTERAYAVIQRVAESIVFCVGLLRSKS